MVLSNDARRQVMGVKMELNGISLRLEWGRCIVTAQRLQLKKPSETSRLTSYLH